MDHAEIQGGTSAQDGEHTGETESDARNRRIRRPGVCGVNHVKLPVRDPALSREWYGRILGFEQEIEFVEDGVLMGVALRDPDSGVRVSLRRAPQRAEALRGFVPWRSLSRHVRSLWRGSCIWMPKESRIVR